MKKAPVFEIQAPCKDTSFEVASDHSAHNSPISQEACSFTAMMALESEGGLRFRDEDELRCHESIIPEDLRLQHQPLSVEVAPKIYD